MMIPLGKNQRAVIDLLLAHGSWYAGCDWTGTPRNMGAICESLCRRDLVCRTVFQRNGCDEFKYELSEAGKTLIL